MESNGLKYGVILGLVYIAVLILFYFTNLNFLFSPFYTIPLTIVVFCVGAYLAISNEKAKLGGFIDFRQAFREGFIVVFAISAISGIFTYLLFSVIDPQLIELGRDYQIELLLSSWASELLSEEQKEQMVLELQKNETVSLNTVVFKGAIFTLLGAFFAWIIAFFMKEESPESDREVN